MFYFDAGMYFDDYTKELMKEALDEKLRLALAMDYRPPEKKVEEEVTSTRASARRRSVCLYHNIIVFAVLVTFWRLTF